MLTLKITEFEQIRNWIYRNARPLELALWRYFFESGGKEPVLSALSVYQNEDGGFGNALEPDSWNPESSPYTTLYAINTLKSIDFFDMNHPVYAGILRFLDSGLHAAENGWVFSIPSNNSAPHAPWWTYSEASNACEDIGVTAELSAFILRHTDKDSPLFQKALDNARRLIKTASTPGNYGDMGVSGFCVLLETIGKTGLSEQLRAEAAAEQVRKLVHDTIVRDTNKWPQYNVKPSNYIKGPGSIYCRDNADIVETELDYLIRTRPAGTVWGIEWSWFENNAIYPKELAISENWWRAITAIGKLRYLQAFGRVEG